MKLFVWDFHGTLEKDNEGAVLEISNKVLKNLGYKERLTEKDNFMLYGRKWSDYFAHLLPNEPEETHFFIQQKCIEYEGKYPEIIKSFIKPNDHAHEVLSKIKKVHKQILVSNMSNVGLKHFMNAVNMWKYFPKGSMFATNSYKLPRPKRPRHSPSSLHERADTPSIGSMYSPTRIHPRAYSPRYSASEYKKQIKLTKKEVLANYLKGKKFDKVITIGDTKVDVEMGKAVGATIYLYAHPGREFAASDADYKIRDLREVLKEI